MPTKDMLEKENAALRRRVARLEKQVAKLTAQQKTSIAETGQDLHLFEELLENVPVGIVITGGPPDFPIKHISRFGLEMTRQDSDRLIGLATGFHQLNWGLLLSDGETRPQPEQMPLYRASRFGERVQNEEFVLVTADLRHLTVLVDAAPIRDAKGNIIGAINTWRDITMLKRAEQDLRESEQRFSSLFNYSPLAMVVSRLSDGLMIEGNPAFQILLGYSRTELIGRNAAELETRENLEERKIFAEQLQTQKSVKNFETVARTRSGTGVNVLISAQIVEINDEEYLLAQIVDITERKRIYQQLQEREHFISSVLNLTPANIYVYDMETQSNVFSMDGINRLLGYSAKDIQSMGSELFATLVHPDDLAGLNALQTRIMTLKDGEILEDEHRAKHRDGSWHTLHTYESPFLRNTDGTLKQKIGVAIDITESKLAEQKLSESEKKFLTIFECSPLAIGISRMRDNRFADVNPAFCNLFGYTRVEILEHTSQELGLWVEPGERQRMLEQLKTQTNIYGFETCNRHKSGKVIDISISAQIIKISNEEYLLGQIIDITDHKRSHQEVEELLLKVRQSHAQLHALSRKLIEVQENERRALGRELHDEIGQSLTGLKILLEMAAHKSPEPASEKLEQAIQITNDLLERTRRLSLNLRPAILDDMGLLPALLWLIQNFKQQASIEVEFVHQGLHQRFAPAVETAVYRLIQEALTNIVRHAQVQQARVHITCDQTQIELIVEDTGQGFDTEDKFIPGRTVGLQSMRERIALLDGEFSLQSQPGLGTKIMIRIPLDESRERN